MPHIDDHEKPEEKTALVGVTGSVRQDLRQPALAEMDYLIDEVPLKERATTMSTMVLVVRADGDPKALIPALTNALREVDPTVPLADPRTMSDAIADELALERMEVGSSASSPRLPWSSLSSASMGSSVTKSSSRRATSAYVWRWAPRATAF